MGMKSSIQKPLWMAKKWMDAFMFVLEEMEVIIVNIGDRSKTNPYHKIMKN